MALGQDHEVISARRTLRVGVGSQLLGRIIDGLGNPIDGKGPIASVNLIPLHAAPPPPLSSQRIRDRISLGVRAIDGHC